jgi:hypothetical protein
LCERFAEADFAAPILSRGRRAGNRPGQLSRVKQARSTIFSADDPSPRRWASPPTGDLRRAETGIDLECLPAALGTRLESELVGCRQDDLSRLSIDRDPESRIR